MADRFAEFKKKKKLGDRKLKQLLNSVIAKYRDLCLADPLFASAILDLLATDQSRYFAKPWPIIVKWYLPVKSLYFPFLCKE